MYFTFANIRKFYKVTEFPLCSNGINNKKRKKNTRYTPPRGYLNEPTWGKKKCQSFIKGRVCVLIYD